MLLNSILAMDAVALRMPGVLVALLPLVLALYYVRRTRVGRRRAEANDICDILHGHEYEIALYSFDGEPESIADITAKHFGAYRVSGMVESYGHPVYGLVFHPCERTVFELGAVLMQAKEVHRVDDRTTVYLFADHEARHSDQPEVAEITSAMAAEAVMGKSVLMSVTRHSG